MNADRIQNDLLNMMGKQGNAEPEVLFCEYFNKMDKEQLVDFVVFQSVIWADETLRRMSEMNKKVVKKVWEGRYNVSVKVKDTKPMSPYGTTFILNREMEFSEYERLCEPFNLPKEDTEEFGGMDYKYAVSVADETFTKEEAEQVKEYMEARLATHGVTVEIKPAYVPSIESGISHSVLAVGGRDGMYDFYLEDGYSLPFKVSGYYEKWDVQDD